MDTQIAVALIGLIGSAFGSMVGVVVSSNMTTYRIEQLEKKVEKHNKVIERTYKLEQKEALLEARLEEYEKLYAEKLKVANHRIEDLGKEGSV
jgi:hypothetical protein